MIKAIIFDCFGVLVGGGFKATFRSAGGDPVKDAEFINDILLVASRGAINSEDFNRHIADKLHISVEHWQEVVAQSELPHEDMMNLVRELKPDYRLAILSNANYGVMQRKFTPEQLRLFDAVVVSAEVGLLKPDPQIYTHTAEQLGVIPSECVFIDDNESYCNVAASLGMQPIWYRNFDEFKAQLDRILTHI